LPTVASHHLLTIFRRKTKLGPMFSQHFLTVAINTLAL
jgi:hypothetical protein